MIQVRLEQPLYFLNEDDENVQYKYCDFKVFLLFDLLSMFQVKSSKLSEKSTLRTRSSGVIKRRPSVESLNR